MNRNKCVIAVPIYKEFFDFDEYNSIKQLFKILPVEKYDIIAYGPESLNRTYYFNNFNFTNHYYFWDSYFNDYPRGYNSLMLKSGFYECFSEYEYMLVYQPDCWVFKDELEYWCNKGYDYIGAPNIFNGKDKFWLFNITNIGNGGFSLRNIKWWINACEKYKGIADTIVNSNSTMYGEDHFFSELVALGIQGLNVPTFYECSKFSFEIQPHLCYQVIDFKLPFGCHAYKKIEDSEFWNEFIVYDRKLYSVVTFLFGDYDILRDPDEIDEEAEYICITDRDDLKSDVWKFKKLDFPNIDNYNNWQKSMIARYTALNYINSDICIKIDASVHIKKSLKKLMIKFNLNDKMEAGYLLHPWRDSYLDEYDEWITKRGLDPIQKTQFIEYCKNHNYDINKKGMIMTTIMVQKNTHYNREVNRLILEELINNNDFNQRVDQTYFSIIFSQKYAYSDYQFLYFSMQILDSDYFEYFYHGKDYTHTGEYKYDLTKIDYKYLSDRKLKCYYLV